MARIGVSADGRSPVAAFLAQAAAAEAAGATTLWVASHLFQRDPFTLAAMALARTRDLRVALMAVSPYTVHPVQLAMSAATLDERYPGRVVLCLGSGAPADLADAGVERSRPLATMRETFAIVRGLLAGDSVRFEGEVFSIRDRGLAGGACAVPVYLAASGPRMLAFAGAEADGVVLSAAASEGFVRASLDRVAAGAGGRVIDRVGLIYTSVTGHAADDHARLRRQLATVLRGAHHRANLESAGTDLDQVQLAARMQRDGPAAAAEMITDAVIARHALAGDAGQIRHRLESYTAAGLDEVVLAGLHDPDETRAALQATAINPRRGAS